MARVSVQSLVSGVVAKGTYVIRIDEVELGESRQGNPKISFSATVTRGDRRGETIKWSRSLMPRARWSLGTDLVNARIISNKPGETVETDELPRLAAQLTGNLYNATVDVVEGREGGQFNDVQIEGPFGDGDTPTKPQEVHDEF